MPRPTVRELVELWNLQPMGTENVLYTQTYNSETASKTNKASYTAIIALLTHESESFSDMHRLASDELWHFYLGDPIELLLLYPDGGDELVVLGNDVLAGQRLQFLVPAGVWMGAQIEQGGEYGVFGNTMAPGFSEQDFEAGVEKDLVEQWPRRKELISRLTRC